MRRIEDHLTSGLTLEETAEKEKVTIIKVAAINSKGEGEGEKTLQNLSARLREKAIKIAFSTELKAQSLMQEEEEMFFLLRTDNVMPKHVLSFEEAQEELRTLWSIRQKKELAHQKAKQYAAHFSNIKDVMTMSDVQFQERERVPKSLVNALYSIKKTGDVVVYEAFNGYYVVMMDAQYIPERKNIPIKHWNQLDSNLQATMQDEMLQAFIDMLISKYPIQRNVALMKKLKI